MLDYFNLFKMSYLATKDFKLRITHAYYELGCQFIFNNFFRLLKAIEKLNLSFVLFVVIVSEGQVV